MIFTARFAMSTSHPGCLSTKRWTRMTVLPLRTYSDSTTSVRLRSRKGSGNGCVPAPLQRTARALKRRGGTPLPRVVLPRDVSSAVPRTRDEPPLIQDRASLSGEGGRPFVGQLLAGEDPPRRGADQAERSPV